MTRETNNKLDELKDMAAYIGTKCLNAKPMLLGEYNEYRGWKLPEDENYNAPGYIVQYIDGYVSWSPKKQFEDAYRQVNGMNFGLAIEAMKKGMKVARAGWNGKGMFIVYVPGTKNVTFTEDSVYGAHLGTSPGQEILPHFDMFTAQGCMQPGWLASQSDMAADDWNIVELV